MIAYENIRDVHLEMSTLCNAICPLCPRNFHGYPFNDGYPEVNLTLENAKRIFSVDFIKQLTTLRINGNYGDIIMNPEAVDIIKYFRDSNTFLDISISTNGSGRNKNFWEGLAKLRTKVWFCLDGLEDTHDLYRQNTSWKTIIKNASVFISAGGSAVWKFIKFNHNKHQIEQCRDLSEKMKFIYFDVVDHGRNTGPVFNKSAELTHTLGDYIGPTDFKVILFNKKTDLVLLEDIILNRQPKNKIMCKAKEKKSIYVAANGEVYPCCWMGFYPRTFGHGEYHQAVNSQIIPLLTPNNATEHTLEDCISWFNNVAQTWNTKTYEQGRLVVCDDICGSN